MALTPEEIVSYDLKQSVRGYSVAQVDELLDLLADQVEAAELEHQRLEQRLKEAEARLAATQETESTLQRTLITAQQAAERSLQDAREEADALLTRAREEAAEVEQAARDEADRMRDEARTQALREAEESRRRRAALQERIDELAEQERRYRAHLRELLQRQLSELDELDAIDPAAAAAAGSVPASTDDPGDGPTGDEPTEDGHEDHDGTESSPGRGQDGAGGLTVRVHGAVGDDPGQDSPLGSQSSPGEE